MKMMRAVAIALVSLGVLAAQGQVGQTASQTTAKAAEQVAAKRPMTFADLMAMKRVSDPQISPSGKWVLFSVTDVSLEKNTKVNHLWVVALGGGATEADSSAALRNDKQKTADDKQKEKQVTFGEGESFGRFSPDGKWVSMTMKEQIYQAPWDEGTGRLGAWAKMTNVAGGADGAIWSPDSKRLMFVADVYPECSDQHMWPQENACDKAKDEAAAASSKGQVWDALLYRHWDQYTGLKRSHILVVDFVGNVRDLTPASAVGDAETPTWMLGGPLEYAWAPDSKEIAYVTNLDKVPAASTNNDVFTLRLDEPGAKAVKVSTSPGSDDEPEYSPDGKWLAFRSQKQAGFESDRFRLMLFDREKKTIKELMPKFDYWVDEFVWVPDSAAVVFTSGEEGMESISSYNVLPDEKPGDHPVFAGITAQGEYGDLRVWQKEVGSGDVQIVASKMTVASPAEIVTINAGMLGHTFYDITEMDPTMMKRMGISYVDPKVSGKLIEEEQVSPEGERQLTHLNQSLLGSLALAPLDYFWFTGAEGTKVQAFLIKPPGFDPAKKYPVKFVMHGGPQTALGDSWSYRWNWELLAADGYVVVGINRRGSTGYGQKFVDEVSGDWGGRAYEDLMKGLDYAEATYPFIDKTRECALGASYGGFMADWVLTHTNRFQCIVTHDGMVDPVSAYGTTEEMWFNEWEFRRPEDFPKGWDGFSASYNPMAGIKADSSAALRNDKQKSEVSQGGGHAAEPWRYQSLPADQDPFRKWSPMRFIENAKTPTLIIHSQRDYRLDVSQGFELYTSLQRRGVPARFLYFPDEGHWVLKPQNSQLWYETVADWCDRWTKTGKYAETVK